MTELAPYAITDPISRGRRHAEPAPEYRNHFQRDRDRIVHSTAFRRLEYKTQVFVNHEGDLFRTRLTHSIEVAQIGRAVARTLRLNEDLTEAIALAHDLGHTPFGHAGQDALNHCMTEFGGFEHNLQSLRVVDVLEEKYAEFVGLNLCFETREGILKHCAVPKAKELGDVAQRFLTKQQPSLEAQLANLADEIAYNNHDIDDGLRAGLLSLDQLRAVEVFRVQHDAVIQRYPGLNERRVIHEVVRRMINQQVTDLIEHSRATLEHSSVKNVDEVRAQAGPLLGFSQAMSAMNLELKRFLRQELYAHYRVYRMSDKAKRILTALFEAFMHDPKLLPPEHAQKAATGEREDGLPGRARAVADYVAGMTDRYAIREYRRLFEPLELT
ncbi:MAG: deoxyguanosinetriphosphate triphosphohydrolase [Pseudomonadota bacterium]